MNSLHPAAMINQYLVGVPVKLLLEHLEQLHKTLFELSVCPKLGIYRIKYISNKNLIDAILPRREDGCLKWDLRDGE